MQVKIFLIDEQQTQTRAHKSEAHEGMNFTHTGTPLWNQTQEQDTKCFVTPEGFRKLPQFSITSTRKATAHL